MPGPTGEKPIPTNHARGTVLVLGPDKETAIEQMVYGLLATRQQSRGGCRRVSVHTVRSRCQAGFAGVVGVGGPAGADCS